MDELTYDKRMEEADNRERDLASGWKPGEINEMDEDDGEGNMHPIVKGLTFNGVRPYIRFKDCFFDEQMARAEEEKDLRDRFAY